MEKYAPKVMMLWTPFTTPQNSIIKYYPCSSRLVTVLMGTLWSSKKQIEFPYVFDWENAIALRLQGNRPHLAGRGKSHGFSRVAAGTWGIFSSYSRNSIRNSSLFIEVRNLSRYEGQLRNVN